MRKQDLVPVALLGGIAVFVILQAVSMPAGEPPAAETAASVASPSPASAPASAAPQGAAPDTASTPKTAAAETAASSDSTAPRHDVDVVDAGTSLPAPNRDPATVAMLIRDGAPGTYLLEMLPQLDSVLTRWPDRRAEAIRVWIDREPAVRDWDPSYAVVAEHVFEEWQRAGSPLRFVVLRDSANTEIRIRWVETFPEEQGPKLGMARKRRDQHGWIHEVEITVATHDPRGRRLPPEVVAGTARHEVGHALGLAHSPSTADVMYSESGTTRISATDIATLRLLYILPPGRVK